MYQKFRWVMYSLGIRTIFESIKSSEVFTVVFKKQDKPKAEKANQRGERSPERKGY